MSMTNKHYVRLAANRGASLFRKFIFLCAMLVASHVSLADAELDRMKEEISKEAYVEVTTAPDVQQQINKLSLADKNRAEAAIKVGAAYVKVYLHGVSSCEVSDLWDAYMGGLTQTDDAWDWYGNFCGGKNGYLDQALQPVACSPAILGALQFKDGGVMLVYQITRLGGFIVGKDGVATVFKPLGVGETRSFKVSINERNRIYDIDPRGDPAEISYVRVIEFLNYSLRPRNLLGLSAVEVVDRKAKTNMLIQQIEQQAAQICK